MAVAPPKNAKSERRSLREWRRLIRYISPYRTQFVVAIVSMSIFGATDGAIPFLIKYILDGVFGDQNRTLLFSLPAILMCFALLRAGVDFLQQYLTASIGHNVVRDIRNDLNAKFLSQSGDYYLRNSSADLITRTTGDVLLVRSLLVDTIAALLRDSVRILALLITAVYLDPFLALIAIVGFPLCIYPIYKFSRKMRRLSRRGQEGIGALASILDETIAGHRVVKVFGRQEYEEERFRKANEDLNNTLHKSERIRALTGPINEVLATAAICGVILYGGLSVISGVRSQGEFIAFLLSVFLLYDPFKKLGRVNNLIQQGLAGAERLFEVLDSTPTVQDPLSPLSLPSENHLRFKGVSFRYPGASEMALSGIDLEVPPGKKVALVGFSGSGKSTLVDLVCRFMDPTSGVITLGDVDISKLKLEDLRSRLTMVSQHTFLFNDSVRNNILYGRADASDDEVVMAAKRAYALDFIQALPQGFDTKLGEAGMSLSGGERQRIAIARAILKDAPILILDEATASLDNRAEKEVQAAIQTLEKGRSTIVIAHRLSTVMDADEILVMSNGRIVEAGTHDQMLKRSGPYSQLYSMQFNQGVEGRPIEEATFTAG